MRPKRRRRGAAAKSKAPKDRKAEPTSSKRGASSLRLCGMRRKKASTKGAQLTCRQRFPKKKKRVEFLDFFSGDSTDDSDGEEADPEEDDYAPAPAPAAVGICRPPPVKQMKMIKVPISPAPGPLMHRPSPGPGGCSPKPHRGKKHSPKRPKASKKSKQSPSPKRRPGPRPRSPGSSSCGTVYPTVHRVPISPCSTGPSLMGKSSQLPPQMMPRPRPTMQTHTSAQRSCGPAATPRSQSQGHCAASGSMPLQDFVAKSHDVVSAYGGQGPSKYARGATGQSIPRPLPGYTSNFVQSGARRGQKGMSMGDNYDSHGY